MVLCAVYAIWLHNRINFGSLKIKYIQNFKDLTVREFYILSFLILVTLIIGIYPMPIISSIHATTTYILFNI
jgi:NADH-quinone oxidoreductase subunit M